MAGLLLRGMEDGQLPSESPLLSRTGLQFQFGRPVLVFVSRLVLGFAFTAVGVLGRPDRCPVRRSLLAVSSENDVALIDPWRAVVIHLPRALGVESIKRWWVQEEGVGMARDWCWRGGGCCACCFMMFCLQQEFMLDNHHHP